MHAVLALALFPFAVQDPKPAAPQAPAVAAPSAAEAKALLERAVAKMRDVTNGKFKTTAEQDSALARRAPMGAGEQVDDVDGGWHGDVRWATTGEGDEYVLRSGRMAVKDGANWKLRAAKLPSGGVAPFTLDPQLLFALLAELPEKAREIAHVETGDAAGKSCAVVSLVLDGENASDLALSGALPSVAGGPLLMLGAMGGMAPAIEHSIDLALWIDPASGEVLRLRAKVYETNPILRNIRVQVGGPGGAGDEDEPEAEATPAADAAAAGGAKELTWKRGLPERKVASDTSVCSYKVDFLVLGAAEAPKLDPKAKTLLGVR